MTFEFKKMSSKDAINEFFEQINFSCTFFIVNGLEKSSYAIVNKKNEG